MNLSAEWTQNLSKNLRALRLAKGLSQADTAKLCDLPRSTLTNIEAGGSNPSLQILARLSQGLGLPLAELVARPRQSCQLLRASDLREKRIKKGEVRVFDQLPEPVPGFQVEKMEFQPGGSFQGHPHLAGTREFLSCVQGEIVVYVSGDNFHLFRGDVLVFPGNRSHSYRNPSETLAICFSVVSLFQG